MLRSKEVFTICTPIPSVVPRQLAVDVLHDHSEVITLNPLVIGRKAIQPPPNAPSDEIQCAWYEITERIKYVPGLGKLGSKIISFSGCFHDMPWGLQTHTYAPMGVDLRISYRVAGSPIGSFERKELMFEAFGAPAEGLYVRADVEVVCNMAFTGFVRSQTKNTIQEMVDRMVKRAESLDSSALAAMFNNEKYIVVPETNTPVYPAGGIRWQPSRTVELP